VIEEGRNLNCIRAFKAGSKDIIILGYGGDRDRDRSSYYSFIGTKGVTARRRTGMVGPECGEISPKFANTGTPGGIEASTGVTDCDGGNVRSLFRRESFSQGKRSDVPWRRGTDQQNRQEFQALRPDHWIAQGSGRTYFLEPSRRREDRETRSVKGRKDY